MFRLTSLFFLLACWLLVLRPSTSFAPLARTASTRQQQQMPRLRVYASTVEAPTREDTDRRTRRQNDEDLGDFGENFEDAVRTKGPLEYLEDPMESREMDDPFHILLLGQTFDKPKITVPYVTSSLNYVLGMPLDEAEELSQFAHDHGMSCLGTWSREECLSLGRALQVRDLVCRVVPYCEGGQRGWQAKDASNSQSSAV